MKAKYRIVALATNNPFDKVERIVETINKGAMDTLKGAKAQLAKAQRLDKGTDFIIIRDR